jgi:uncharacterized protein with PIN domain
MTLQQVIDTKKDSTQRFPTDRCPVCGKNLMEIDISSPDSGYNYLFNSSLKCTSCSTIIATKI